MPFSLLIIDHVCGEDYKNPCYSYVGKFYKTRSAAQNGKKKFSFHRSGVVKHAKELAAKCNLRSPWKIEEYNED
jgi:hypothetical protein